MGYFLNSDSYRDFDDDFHNRNQRAHVLCCCRRSDWESQERLLVMYSFGKDPQLMTCPSCRSAQDTRVVFESTSKTHAMAAVLAPVLLCWFPYVSKTFRVALHYCSVCGAFIGRSGLQKN